MPDVSILQEAEELINGERQAAYGNATDSFENIGALWGSYLGVEITSFDVANLMVLLKVSRTRKLYHRDSYVDIAGYAALAERLHVETSETADEGEEGFTPRTWDSLYDIPESVTVGDAGGWEWTKRSGILYYTGPTGFNVEATTSQIENTHRSYDTFTEVVTEEASTSRKWDSLAEVPKDVAVFDAGGHYWSFWGPDRENEYGQVITVGDGEWLWTTKHSLEIRVSGHLGTAPFTETDLV